MSNQNVAQKQLEQQARSSADAEIVGRTDYFGQSAKLHNAMLVRYMLSSCVSVCVSVTVKYCIKSAKPRIMQTDNPVAQGL